jgi:hypothetical protein
VHDRSVPFPPPPRTSTQLYEHVLGALQELPAGARLPWHPIRIAGLDAPWVGVRPEGSPFGPFPRAWTWDVVTPEDKDSDPFLRRDPLAVAVHQDVVLASVGKGDLPPVVSLRVPVREAPDRIDVDRNALPPQPWRVDLSTGWSQPVIAAALAGWAAQTLGRTDLDTGDGADRDPVEPPEDDRFEVGDGVSITGAAFDRLLAEGPDVAAIVCGTLAAICEALEPYR